MEKLYWVQEWAKVRQNELVRLPKEMTIHGFYTDYISREDFEIAFRDLWNLFSVIYGDIINVPEAFGMPLYDIKEYGSLSVQARESRSAPYRPINLLYNLFISGTFQGDDFVVDGDKFYTINKVKSTKILLAKLSDYGFVFDGLAHGKIETQYLTINYSDNKNLLYVIKYMADKANHNHRLDDFLSCHYKLFQDDMLTVNYGNSVDIVADKMHTEEEQDFIYSFDTLLREKGYFSKEKSWNEGPGYAYYDKVNIMNNDGPYHYWMISWKTELILYLRIRNATKCLEYLEKCPDTIKQIFLHHDEGCKNRLNGSCKYGQVYTIDQITYHKCGCCNAPFYFKPKKNDIPHYIKLIELGVNK